MKVFKEQEKKKGEAEKLPQGRRLNVRMSRIGVASTRLRVA